MPPTSSPNYTVSPELIAREDFRSACADRDFAKVFQLMRKYDGASQDKIASPVDGLTQSRVSKIMRGADRIATLELIERIADSLHIPGPILGLAPRPWETVDDVAVIRESTTFNGTTPLDHRELIDNRLSLHIEIAPDGAATLHYRQELHNGSDVPFTRLIRGLWFENTTGPLEIEAAPVDESDPDARNLIIQKLHQTKINAHYACQVFPAVQPGETATIAYTCLGGRFVDQHYWRQSVIYPARELNIRVTHHGIQRLTGCSATEERADGGELSVADSLSWKRVDDAVVIDLTRHDLAVNQALLLRWDFARASS